MNTCSFLSPCGGILLLSMSVVPASAGTDYRQTNLVSNQPGQAAIQDSSLVNAWGMSESATSPLWISDNGTGVSTLYSIPAGNPAGLTKAALTVTVPPTAGGLMSAPTGQVFNGGPAFGGANFVFDSEDGVISGWSSGTSAVVGVDHGSSAVYKGLAIANPGLDSAVIYATNFRAGTIEAYKNNFASASLPGDFQDPTLPTGYAPFNDQVIGGELYVTYALQDAAKHDDQPGAGNGFVDVFNLDGTLKDRLISGGALNSPWGLAMAPSNFGAFGGDLLVGNFGDGRINAYNAATGQWLGALDDASGNPLVIDGLWGLMFGNGVNGGGLDTLFFTAGPDGESNGLFGSLTAVPETSTWAMLVAGFASLGFAAMRRRGAPFAKT